MKTRIALAVAGLMLAGNPAAAQDHPWTNAKLSPDARAALVLAQMTQDEKFQLLTGYFGTDMASRKFTADPLARAGSAGYIAAIPRLGIPAQWQTDAGIGVATQGGAAHKRERTALPSGLATAATWNPALAFRGGAMIGSEARASGFNVMLAGGVNLMREPRNGRNFEYAGEDPYLAGVMVGAQAAGIQSNHIISTIKHYAVNDQETDRGAGNSVIDPAAARMSDLLAFQIAIERSDAGSIMCSYNKVNGTHSCENPWLLNDVLRRDWGFKGYVMSDWGGVHSSAPAANAGLEQQSGYPFDAKPWFGALLRQALAEGQVTQARIDEMASRVLRAMFAHGLVDHPVTSGPLELPKDMLARNAAISRADAEESLVLLRNEKAILPLSSSAKKIVVIGGHADKGVLAGSGSSLVYPVGGNAVPGIKPTEWPGPVMYYPDAPLAAIRAQAPGAQISFVDGSDPAAAAAAARAADVAIVFATQWAGEAFDVSLTLADGQDALIESVAAANPRTVVVLETGGPVLTPWRDRVQGIVAAWYPGTLGGQAIAKVLFGKVNPSGHLPASFPASLDHLPKPSVPNKGDTSYTEGATVGYKWLDAKNLEPAYPFGHGLSYTSFAYSNLRVTVVDGAPIASFTVRNTGSRAGAAVPQIYVGGSGWEAPRRLGGFRKVPLAPGASATVSVAVDPRLLATFDETARQWRIAAGSYEVALASSARSPVAKANVALPARLLPVSWHPAPVAPGSF